MPVDNNEHQKIDDVSTGLRYTVTRDNGFRMNCLLVLSKRHNDGLSYW